MRPRFFVNEIEIYLPVAFFPSDHGALAGPGGAAEDAEGRGDHGGGDPPPHPARPPPGPGGLGVLLESPELEFVSI